MSASNPATIRQAPVVIVGGGLAGLATAAALADRGVRSVLLESRPRLGGRASSFHDPASDQWIDNCQHVAMGCCTNFRAFCELTGLADRFRREDVLYFIAPDGRINPFSANLLPAPLHLSGAFAGLSYLNWKDKLALARGLRVLARSRPTDTAQTFADWLEHQHQPRAAVERFWKVVLVSALSESLDRIGVPQARKVFVDGFLRHRDAWKVEIPRTPLEELYGSRLMHWLTDRGVEVRCLTAATHLQEAEGQISGVRLRDGSLITADDYVLAVPHHRLAALLPAMLRTDPFFAGASQLESAPISSLHLWFDRPIMSLPHAVFTEGLVQWVFNRTALSDQSHDEGQPWYFQVVISASRDVVALDSDRVREQVLDELARVWPEARIARLINTRQVTEHRAVFSVLPGSESLRPSQQSPIPNLQLAGDFTRTEWPATMEGAVRSGFLAAENILRRRGAPANVLQPDLPVARLSRWLFGL